VTTDDFDPDRLKLGAPAAIAPEVPDDAVPEQKVELTGLGGRRRGQYVPAVPMELFDRACVLPGKALAVYLLLWRQSRVEKRATVVLTSAGLAQHGISRHAKETALSRLEQAGLVSVRRRGRRNPEVTLLGQPGHRPPTEGRLAQYRAKPEVTGGEDMRGGDCLHLTDALRAKKE
jgi:hypothetical protein